MCKALEDMCNQAAKEAQKEIALRLLASKKLTLSEIAEVVALPIEEVQHLQAAPPA